MFPGLNYKTHELSSIWKLINTVLWTGDVTDHPEPVTVHSERESDYRRCQGQVRTYLAGVLHLLAAQPRQQCASLDRMDWSAHGYRFLPTLRHGKKEVKLSFKTSFAPESWRKTALPRTAS